MAVMAAGASGARGAIGAAGAAGAIGAAVEDEMPRLSTSSFRLASNSALEMSPSSTSSLSCSRRSRGVGMVPKTALGTEGSGVVAGVGAVAGIGKCLGDARAVTPVVLGVVLGVQAGGAALVATSEAEASPLALHEPFGDGVPIGIKGGARSYREGEAVGGAVTGASGGLDDEGKTGVANWFVQSRALAELPCSNEMRSEL